MSSNPETDLNLEKLFQPSWVKESSDANQYAKYEPRERPDRGDRRGRDQSRRDPRGERRFQGGDRGPRQKGGFKGRQQGDRFPRRETPPPLPELNVAIQAEDKGADSLARQIKTTGRAYPLFDIASMILQKPERYGAVFSVKKGPDGKVLEPLFACALDDSLWLSQDEAVAHVLKSHLATFYQTERTETDPPKGTYTFVAQCGMSGVIFGPPNHHDYQTKLRELHSQRFSRLPFEAYKSRVKIVRDEAVVKQWVDEQSWKTEYTCLNVPEAARLPDMAAVETHFREVHLPTIISQVDSHTLPGLGCNKLRGPLWRAFHAVLDSQRRFPMQVATSLSQQFASRGLQFFKVNKTITHVWVARPTFLDLDNEPVSDKVRSIVQFVNEHPKCTRRQLIETLSPSPAPTTVSAEGEPAAEAKPTADAKAAPEHLEPTPEQTALIGDLHWLIHQGHVIEFATGLMETAKKPGPRPQPTPKKKKVKVPAAAKPETTDKATAESTPSKEAESATAVPAAEVKGDGVVAESKSEPAADASKTDAPSPTPSEPSPPHEVPAEPTAAKPEETPVAPPTSAQPEPSIEPEVEKQPSELAKPEGQPSQGTPPQPEPAAEKPPEVPPAPQP